MIATKKYGTRYPWDDWLGSLPRVFRVGDDFDCSPQSFALMLRAEIEKRFGRGRWSVLVVGEEVHVTRYTRSRAKIREYVRSVAK